MATRRLNPLYADQQVSNLGFPIIVEKNPESGALSTYHGLSRQRYGTTGRPGRVATPRSSHTFESALTQNTGGGIKTPDIPQPAPTVFGGGAGGGTDSASPGNPFGAVGEAVSAQIGENIGKGMIGLASKGVAQGLSKGMPIGVTPAAFAIGALSPIGLANSAIGKGISGHSVLGQVAQTGFPPDVQTSIALDALSNAPQTALGHLAALLGLATSADEATSEAIAAAEAQSPTPPGVDTSVASGFAAPESLGPLGALGPPPGIDTSVAMGFGFANAPGGAAATASGIAPGGSVGPVGTPGFAGMASGPLGGTGTGEGSGIGGIGPGTGGYGGYGGGQAGSVGVGVGAAGAGAGGK